MATSNVRRSAAPLEQAHPHAAGVGKGVVEGVDGDVYGGIQGCVGGQVGEHAPGDARGIDLAQPGQAGLHQVDLGYLPAKALGHAGRDRACGDPLGLPKVTQRLPQAVHSDPLPAGVEPEKEGVGGERLVQFGLAGGVAGGHAAKQVEEGFGAGAGDGEHETSCAIASAVRRTWVKGLPASRPCGPRRGCLCLSPVACPAL